MRTKDLYEDLITRFMARTDAINWLSKEQNEAMGEALQSFLDEHFETINFQIVKNKKEPAEVFRYKAKNYARDIGLKLYAQGHFEQSSEFQEMFDNEVVRYKLTFMKVKNNDSN